MKQTKALSYILVLVVMALLTSVCMPVFADETKAEAINEAKASFSDLYEAINPSVVYVYVAKAVEGPETTYQIDGDEFDFGDIFGPEFDRFFRQFEQQDDRRNEEPKEQEPQLTYGSGTGFVWDEAGHIVTNNHVIEDAVEVTITYSDGIERKATVIGADPDSDLAVLEVENPKTDLIPVTMGDSSALKPGELAAAIGNPLGQTGTMTQGIISALGRSYAVGENDGTGNYTIPDVIQTDASINPGNSGGVLINIDGEVIGVVMAFSSYSHSSAGIGYAIPSNLVKRVIPDLIEKGSYEHPWIGFSGIALTPEVNELLELDHDQRGAYIQTIQPKSPAEAAGIRGGDEDLEISKGVFIRAGGDIVTKINDRDVKAMDDIIAYLSSNTSIGDTLTLHILRDGKEMDVDLVLAARPTAAERAHAAEAEAEPEEEEAPAETGRASLGAMVSDLTPQTLDLMGLPEDTKGVLINEVFEDTPADIAGLRGSDDYQIIDGLSYYFGGDIITKFDGEEITGTNDLVEAIGKHLPGDLVTVTIIRDGESEDIRLYLGNSLSR